ncbi:MAG TPA: hypothetical protein VNY35_07430 [Solirubrobacteraceae bacterium]|jgi:hypothetical protein|nr:hypothetical protein [Solirubrobacteraceae bacterium]
MRRSGLVLAAAAVMLFIAAGSAAAAPTDLWLEYGTSLNGDVIQPSTSNMATMRAALNAATQPNTVPFWQSSFSYQGARYPFQMLGSNPSAGRQTTVVPTVVIPIDLTFHDVRNGVSANLNGSSIAAAEASSPLFNAVTFAATGDVTQYGDAVQRAEFAGVLGSPTAYHVLLGQPTIMPTAHIDVPASKGFVYDPIGDGVSRGEITDGIWWRAQRHNLIDTYGVTPNQLVIMLTKDTAVGLALGFHGARLNGNHIQTYIWDSWVSPRLAVPLGLPPDFALDTLSLGHEIAEWQNDPFVDNVTPAWSFSVPPVFTNQCSNLLEVGDPLELTEFPVTLGGNTYHLQDIAFLPWFAREATSTAYNGRYSFTGTLETFSTPC